MKTYREKAEKFIRRHDLMPILSKVDMLLFASDLDVEEQKTIEEKYGKWTADWLKRPYTQPFVIKSKKLENENA